MGRHVASSLDVWELSRAVLCDKDGWIAVIKVYMDESGVHDGSPVLTVSAYLGKPKEWRDWTKAWHVAKRPINVFHAVAAQNLQEEFKGWSESDRDALVIRLLPVIADADFPGIVIGLNIFEFEKAMTGHDDLRPLFGTPYAACFQWVVQVIMNLHRQTHSQERMAFVHEVNDYQGEALTAFAWVKQNAQLQDKVAGLLFGSKADYPPLQAADILAYEGNKRLRDVTRPERRPWKVLNPDGRILAAQYGKDNMPDLIDRLEKIRDGRFDEIDFGSGWKVSLGARPS